MATALAEQDPSARNDAGKTALALAAEFNHDPEVVRLLLRAGYDLEARDHDGRTPLMLAARRNTPPVIEALLAAGADPRATDLAGRTAADWAQANRSLIGTPIPRRLFEANYQ